MASESLVPASSSRRSALVSALAEFQSSQRDLALMNSRASALSIFLGLQNQRENARLALRQRELDVRLDAGEQAVMNLQLRADAQGSLLAHARAAVQEHELAIGQLERRVDGQRHQLEILARDFGRELAAQRALLEAHRADIVRLMASRLRQDAAVDAAIVAFAMAISRSAIVKAPASAISYFAAIAGAKGLYVQRLARLAAAAAVMRALRAAAEKRGIHNGVGGPEEYVRQVFKIVAEKVPEAIGVKIKKSTDIEEGANADENNGTELVSRDRPMGDVASTMSGECNPQEHQRHEDKARKEEEQMEITQDMELGLGGSAAAAASVRATVTKVAMKAAKMVQ